jgi:hypothetical protein
LQGWDQQLQQQHSRAQSAPQAIRQAVQQQQRQYGAQVMKMMTRCCGGLGMSHSFIHLCYTCSRSSFEQRQPIPNAADHTKQQTDQTNKQRQLPSRVMSNYVLCSTP